MKLRLLAVFGAGTAALVGSLGCSSDAQSGGGPGGGAGIAGAPNLGGGPGSSAGNAGSAGSSGSAGVTESACPEKPSPLRTQGSVLSLPLQLILAGKPFVFGQPNALADGSSVVPLNVRFYISEVQLLPSLSQQPVAVDIVTATGAPAAYGVHLFNAEDENTGTLRVLAPAGEYAGISFALGIKLSCNQQPPAGLVDPLTNTSQMTWPHTGGFLFLRYEGRNTAADSGGAAGTGSGAEIPPAVHMGGNTLEELVPHVMVTGAFSVPADRALEKGLNVVMDEIFKGATAAIDVSDVTVGFLDTPETIAGERLRRELPQLHPFVLEP